MHFFFLVFILSFSALAQDYAGLAREPKWIKLLHYKRTLLGGWKSEADGRDFFLSKNGKVDPEAELRKASEVFSTTSAPGDDHAICKFPLRYKWLNQKLGNPWKADLKGCRRYLSFFEKLAARRASIVFSSYYLSNPNTAFGHTLLRLSRYDDRNETEMLDYGINYSAQAKSNNPFSYAIKGLLGGFEGRFAAIPYYYKIREYSNSEFRDLWSYDLKLSISEVLEMVDHVWELGNTYFDYYYFHENCSYHLLSVIDVARPELDLTGHFHLFTIPADTIRLLREEGLITEGKRRESTYSKLVRISEHLNADELKRSKEIALHTETTSQVVKGENEKRAAKILDVSLEAFDYLNADKILTDDLQAKEQKHKILTARATNPVITEDHPELIDTKMDSPSLSHAPTRLGLYEGYEGKMGERTRLEFRTAFHDLLDPPRGSLKEAQLEVGNFSVTRRQYAFNRTAFILENLSLVSLKNFPAQNFWANPSSWEIDLGVRQNMVCLNCPQGYFSGSLGNTLQLQEGKFLTAFLVNGEFNVQDFYQNGYRVGVGPKVFTRYLFSEKFLAGIESTYHYNSYGDRSLFRDRFWLTQAEARFHAAEMYSVSLRAGVYEQWRSWRNRFELGLQYFY